MDRFYSTMAATTCSSAAAGNDEFIAGAGADELRGGSGIDIAYYDDSEQSVLIDLAAGTGFGGIAEGDRLFGIENVGGSNLRRSTSWQRRGQRVRGATTARTHLIGRGGADKFDYSATDDSYSPGGGGTSSPTSAGRRGTRSTWQASTPKRSRAATRHSPSSARASSRARASCASTRRTALPTSRPTPTTRLPGAEMVIVFGTLIDAERRRLLPVAHFFSPLVLGRPRRS